MLYVPVVSSTGKPLMPTSNKRANQLIREGRALRRFSKGVFYIRLTQRADGDVQVVAVGIDPGSKKEGFTVKSADHTYLNIQADAVTWVKDAVETRRMLRRSRRNRNTPPKSFQPRSRRSSAKHEGAFSVESSFGDLAFKTVSDFKNRGGRHKSALLRRSPLESVFLTLANR